MSAAAVRSQLCWPPGTCAAHAPSQVPPADPCLSQAGGSCRADQKGRGVQGGGPDPYAHDIQSPMPLPEPRIAGSLRA